jgi:hypothetical protein
VQVVECVLIIVATRCCTLHVILVLASREHVSSWQRALLHLRAHPSSSRTMSWTVTVVLIAAALLHLCHLMLRLLCIAKRVYERSCLLQHDNSTLILLRIAVNIDT